MKLLGLSGWWKGEEDGILMKFQFWSGRTLSIAWNITNTSLKTQCSWNVQGRSLQIIFHSDTLSERKRYIFYFIFIYLSMYFFGLIFERCTQFTLCIYENHKSFPSLFVFSFFFVFLSYRVIRFISPRSLEVKDEDTFLFKSSRAHSDIY